MTSAQRMARWRSRSENRARERKRMTAWRRAHGVLPQFVLTPEEKKVLTRLRNRRRYQRKNADPVWREKRNAYARMKYAEKKNRLVAEPVVATLSDSSDVD
jgi:hypothetical protein